jgi:hypothetical protein
MLTAVALSEQQLKQVLRLLDFQSKSLTMGSWYPSTPRCEHADQHKYL